MIRTTLLWLFIAYLGVIAWGNWYKALCGLILLMAVVEHPDMPKSLFGIQGLNPWNILLLLVLLAWFSHRAHEKLRWDMPGRVNLLLIFYFGLIMVSFFRMMSNTDPLLAFAALRGAELPTTEYLISEHLINCFKWVIPGLLLFDGCRSRERLLWGVGTFLLVYVLLAVQVIKWMPLSGIQSGGYLTERSLKILLNEIGYHRVNLSMMLAGAFWAILAVRPLAGRLISSKLILLAAGIVLLGQALTGGRTGYGTWAMVGILLGMIRWKKLLLLVPIIAILTVVFVPAVKERALQGFTTETRDRNVTIEQEFGPSDEGIDLYTITAGRTFAWPFVVDKILEAPFWGHGKEGMQRTGITTYLYTNYREAFPHPHNAYLQLLLDNGIFGAIPILLFFATILKYSLSLYKDTRQAEFVALGGCTLALVFALLIASMGSQTFYPREGAVGMWCAIGLMLRVHVQRSRWGSSPGNDAQPLWGQTI